MGYDVHITRAEDWSDEEADPISLDEWLAYVNSDPDMRLDGFAEVTTPAGEKLRYENEGLAIWTAYPGGGVWFDYRNGRIVVKNPDEEVLRKMHAIASTFAARVQGDDGELYDEAGGQVPSPTKSFSPSPSPRSWWKRFVGLFARGPAKGAWPSEVEPEASAVVFKVGDRVKDHWENQGTVFEVDAAANHGLGRIRVRYDDGRQEAVALVAPGLALLTEDKDSGSKA